MTEEQYKEKLSKIEEHNLSKQRKEHLKSERQKYKKRIKPPSASKLILLVVVLLCVEIVIFTECIMWKWGDMSALYALIGVPATLIPTILGYFYKSKSENTEGGVVYEMALRNNQESEINEESEETENGESLG